MEKLSISQRSPLSPTRWPTEAFSPGRLLTFIGALLAALLIGLILAALAMHYGGSGTGRAKPQVRLTTGLLIAQLAAYLPILGVTVPLLPKAARRSWSELGLHAPEWRDVRNGALGAVAMYVTAELAALLQRFAFHIEGTQQDVALFGTTHDRSLIVGLIALAVLCAPVVEEIVFRGFVFNAMLRYVPAGMAAVASGLIFGLAHFDATAFFPLACGGIVLALVYYRTGSLVSSMFAHSTFNAVNVMLVLATGGKG